MASAHGLAPAESASRRCVELGWEDDFRSDAGWLAEPWLADEPDEAASARFGPAGAVFKVRAGRGMAWTRTVNPVWVKEFPFLEIVWGSESGTTAVGRPTVVLSDDSTGPVTPDALNPENPLASGGSLQLGPLEPTAGRGVVDLREKYKSDRVARISLALEPGREAVEVGIRCMAFWASDPRQASVAVTSRPADVKAVSLAPVTHPTTEGGWEPIKPTGGTAVTSEWLLKALPALTDWPGENQVELEGIRFQLGGAEHAAYATGVMGLERVEFTGRWRGRELGLLLAARAFGSKVPWFSDATVRLRKDITSPHELIVRLDYADGSSQRHFPWSVARQGYVVDARPEACVVPLAPDKDLVRVVVEDRMTYGQVFVLAASVRQGAGPRLFPDAPPVAPAVEDGAGRQPEPIQTRWSREGDRLTVENAWIRLVADLSTGLRIRELDLVPLGRRLVAGEQSPSWVEVLGADDRAVAMTLRDVQQTQTDRGLTLDLNWSLATEGKGLRLRVEFENTGTVRFVPTLENEGRQPMKATLRVVNLRGFQAAEAADNAWYLIGTCNALLSDENVQTVREYGTAWPLPLIDLFSSRGGGLGLYVADRAALAKRLDFKQASGRADVSIRFLHLEIPAEGRLELPPVVVVPHLGDWHALLAAYRDWAWSAFSPPAARLKDLFYCRRDYPLGGTGYLFDVRKIEYTPDRLIEEAATSLGGLDMIDISGWAFNKATGRVGDYLTNDLGGLAELRRHVEAAHARKKKVGLYFEGYLIDRRSRLASRALPAWQFVDASGKLRWWSGEMEFFACPGVPAWREELARQIAAVAQATGADAVYVDQFGQTPSGKACWCPDHGHPVPSNPAHEERIMLETIRKALDAHSPDTGLYIEYIPGDAVMPLVDAAFDLSMSHWSPGVHPTRLPLYRYVFPEMAAFQMMGYGIRPVPTGVEDLHRSAFHGLGLWLKGRAASWYTPDFGELAKRLWAVYERHGGTFRSRSCEPLIPTLRAGLYANRFEGPGETIITLYNANYSDCVGELVRVPLPPDWVVEDLLTNRAVKVRREGASAVLSGSVEPWSVGIYRLGPARHSRDSGG